MKNEILITGEIDPGVIQTLDGTDNLVITTTSDEAALDQLHRQSFDVLVIGNKLPGEATRKLQTLARFHNEDMVVIDYRGSQQGGLDELVNAGLQQQRESKRRSLAFVDDALKNAGLAIAIQ